MNIIIATNNKHKVTEIKNILNFQVNKIVTLSDINFTDNLIEDGNTYYDNARIKAVGVYEKEKQSIILADDSGLEIDFLDGKPGIHSSRFLPELTQKEKNAEVLRYIGNMPLKHRRARFISVVCCIMPDGESHFFKGICEGSIADAIYGEEGFGYDPIFIPKGFNKTFGILSEDIKNHISHRAQSFLYTKSTSFFASVNCFCKS